MKFYLLLPLIILLSTLACKDDNSPDECWVAVNGTFEWTTIDKAAEYKDGGEDGLYTNTLKAINYPAEARENGIEGIVILQYEITETGEVENILINQDIGGGCGDASKSGLETATVGASFYPAEKDDATVRVRKEMSIKFELE